MNGTFPTSERAVEVSNPPADGVVVLDVSTVAVVTHREEERSSQDTVGSIHCDLVSRCQEDRSEWLGVGVIRVGTSKTDT